MRYLMTTSIPPCDLALMKNEITAGNCCGDFSER